MMGWVDARREDRRDSASMIADHGIAGGVARRTFRAKVVVVARPAGRLLIDVGMVPRVHRQSVILQVRTVPVRNVRRLLHQRLQPLLRAGIIADIELVHVKYRAKPLDRLMRDGRPRVAQLPQDRRRHHADQQSKDGDHDEQFEQGKSGVAPRRTSNTTRWMINWRHFGRRLAGLADHPGSIGEVRGLRL